MKRAKDCDITKNFVCFPKASSSRFLRFLAGFGNLVNTETYLKDPFNTSSELDAYEPYKILWKNELTKVYFHVNTLIKNEGNAHEKFQEFLSRENLVIIWNEYGLLPEVTLLHINSKMCIVVTPMKDSFVNIKINNVIFLLL